MASREYYDAAIVGGGPAGSSSARTLTDAGLKVLLLDKSNFPRDKVCAGWITPEVVELTELDLKDYQQARTMQPIRRFRTGMLGETMLTTDYDNIVSYGILRREFDQYLLQRSGAQLRLGEPVAKVEHEHGEWLINDNISTPLLIGAGGHACPVARMLNPQAMNKGEVVVAQEVEFTLSAAQNELCQVQSDTPELYFLPELDGYGWCFRKGNHLNIGLGRTHNRQLGTYVEWFRRFLIEKRRVPEDTPEHFHGHAYRLATGHAERNIVDNGVMLAGDAVGLAYPHSGEGIRTAIESGILAAEVALDANGDYRRENLKAYETKLNTRYSSGGDAQLLLPHAVRHYLAHLLLSNRFLTRRVVLDNWFLHPG